MNTLKNTINSTKLFVALFLMIFVSHLSEAQTLTIACAANFRDPMTAIIKEFKAENPSIAIRTVFGSSGNLFNQITNNAPFDLYFSANKSYPQKIYEAGLSYDEPKIYAIGQLVLWSKTFDLTSGLVELKAKEVSKIAIANPDLAPYGKSAVACLNYFELYDLIKSKMVTAENISQTAQFVVTGNADVGFLAMSQLKMPAIVSKGSFFVLPAESYPPIEQACVVLKKEGNANLTKKFMDFMSQPGMQEIISSYGYIVESKRE